MQGETKIETIVITEYYQNITKNLGEGIALENKAIKTQYNKPYTTKILEIGDCIIDDIVVKMDGQTLNVDKTNKTIYIEVVTGDIEITVTSKNLKIQVSTPTVSTNNSTNITTSDNENTVEKGIPLYINFKVLTEGITYKIKYNNQEIVMPYEINENGKYIFTIEATYGDKKLNSNTVEVTVNQYKLATEVVAYDAGIWTEEEINTLKTSKLYDYNENCLINQTFKLSDENGLNFTFGGFKAGDTRNKSVSPQSNEGTPKYDGWQILESKEENGKTYVTKIVHAGSPENFVFHYISYWYNAALYMDYLLSNGTRYTEYNMIGNEVINPRSWDMYKDQNQLEIIENVYLMQLNNGDANKANEKGILYTGGAYWLANPVIFNKNTDYYCVRNGKGWVEGYNFCLGIRPVVTLKQGVYIKSGTGVEGNPYVLEKE